MDLISERPQTQYNDNNIIANNVKLISWTSAELILPRFSLLALKQKNT